MLVGRLSGLLSDIPSKNEMLAPESTFLKLRTTADGRKEAFYYRGSP